MPTEPGIRQYRQEVINTADCIDCGAAKGEPCVKIMPRGGRGDAMTYVHDSRSCRHHVLAVANILGLVGRVKPRSR